MRGFADLQSGARVMILGAGASGRVLKRRLVGVRADVTVLGFVDRDVSSPVDGLSVYPFERLQEPDFDALLVASDRAGGAEAEAGGAPVILCDRRLTLPPEVGPYTWLDDFRSTLHIAKPVLVVDCGAGAGRVPDSARHTHFVVSVNAAVERLPWSDVAVLLNLPRLLRLAFGPGVLSRWGAALVPDGLGLVPGSGDESPFAAGFDPAVELQRQFRVAWGWDQLVPFEDIDRVIDLSWLKDRLVRFALENVYWNHDVWPDWPHLDTTLDAFRPERMTRPNTLKAGGSSVHVALSFLHHAGIHDVLLAGVEGEPSVRWTGTQAVLRQLGIRWRRVEDLTDDELRKTFET